MSWWAVIVWCWRPSVSAIIAIILVAVVCPISAAASAVLLYPQMVRLDVLVKIRWLITSSLCGRYAVVSLVQSVWLLLVVQATEDGRVRRTIHEDIVGMRRQDRMVSRY